MLFEPLQAIIILALTMVISASIGSLITIDYIAHTAARSQAVKVRPFHVAQSRTRHAINELSDASETRAIDVRCASCDARVGEPCLWPLELMDRGYSHAIRHVDAERAARA